MSLVIEYGTQIGGAVAAVAGAILTLWTLYARIKKAALRGLTDALDDRFATRHDLKRVEDAVHGVADSVKELTHEVRGLRGDVEPARAPPVRVTR